MNDESNVKNGASLVRDEQGNPIFRTEWLKNGYKIIDSPGEYKNLQVVGEPQYYDPADYGMEGNPRFICNLKGILKSNLPQLAKVATGEHIRYEDLKGLFLNGSIWVNQETGVAPALPHNKSFVDVRVDFVRNQDDTEDVLRITDIYVKEPVEAETLDLSVLSIMAEQE